MRKVKAIAMSLVCAAVLMAASSVALANTPAAGKAKSCCGKNHSKACCKKKNAKCCKPKMKM